MQREIKFRGRTRMTGEWVYGFYVERDGADYGMIYHSSGVGTKVDKKTVGQFTGLKDKSGVKIYEDDYLKQCGIGGDEKDCFIYQVFWNNKTSSFVDKKTDTRLYLINKFAEVIGNIYEGKK